MGNTSGELEEAQRAFDAWRETYNAKRPHEAIGLAVPADRYRCSARAMPRHIDPPEYEPEAQVRKVDARGRIYFKRRKFRCPEAFIGRALALRATSTDGLFDLCYRRHVLAQVDCAKTSFNLLPMSPNTCHPCVRSEHTVGPGAARTGSSPR